MNRSNNVDLPEDLIREILLRLPVKTLLRFKCVCKDWCALIGTQSFIDDHFGHDSNPGCTLFQLHSYLHGSHAFAIHPDERHREASNYISQIAPLYKCFSLLGPANGVFCTVVTRHKRVALFNPAMRKVKPLPPSPFLDFWFFQFGFGFDPFSGDYKVVVLGGLYPRQFEPFFYVYNSSSDSWRKAEFVNSLNERMDLIYDDGVPFNGVIHWINMDLSHVCKSILAFDMRSENFQEIQVPDAIRDAKLEVNISTHGGDSIALMSQSRHENVVLWVMGRDGLWTKSFSIALPQPYMRPLCVWNKNQVLLETETTTHYYTMAALCMFDISTQKVMKFGPEFEAGGIQSVFSYRESLVSIEGSERDGADCIQYFLNFGRLLDE